MDFPKEFIKKKKKTSSKSDEQSTLDVQKNPRNTHICTLGSLV